MIRTSWLRGMLFVLFGAALSALLVVSGCAPYEGQPTWGASVAARSATPCPTYDPQRDAAAEYLGELEMKKREIELTLEYLRLLEEQTRLTESARATQAYWDGVTSTVAAKQTATQNYYALQTATEKAGITATHIHGQNLTSTVGASETAYWDVKTAEAPILAMREAEARKKIAQAEAAARMAELWAWTRWAVVVTAAMMVVGLGAWLVVQWERYRVVRVTKDRILAKLGDGWYDPDRNPYPIASLGPDGRPSLPKTPPDDMQERTTARAQYVDLARASEGKRLPRRSGPIAPPPPANGGARFRVLTPQEAGKALPGVVTPETAQVLEAEWREAHEEGGS